MIIIGKESKLVDVFGYKNVAVFSTTTSKKGCEIAAALVDLLQLLLLDGEDALDGAILDHRLDAELGEEGDQILGDYLVAAVIIVVQNKHQHRGTILVPPVGRSSSDQHSHGQADIRLIKETWEDLQDM